MASSSSTPKAPCATCGSKSAGIFRCEGCVQVFCRKHLNEHRDLLGHQLDEIVIQHDTLQQTIIENRDKTTKKHPILKEIDKWEKDSIMKIQKVANEAREQVNKLNSTQTTSKELHDLAERLQKARVDDDYVETDLRTWITLLKKLKDDVNTFSPSVSLKEDRTEVLVGKIYVSTPTISQRKGNEKFGEWLGNIRIENDGRSAVQCGPKHDAFVRGIGEYSSGKHYIRFLFKKSSTRFTTSFDIISKLCPISEELSSKVVYGWTSQDEVDNGGVPVVVDDNFQDMSGETTFEIELELDCDNQRISYVNQRTRNRSVLDVNIRRCPFPWQIQFYLYEIGDCVHLLP